MRTRDYFGNYTCSLPGSWQIVFTQVQYRYKIITLATNKHGGTTMVASATFLEASNLCLAKFFKISDNLILT
jgi:hypothetical protein